MELKLRASYILLAASIVILAIGIVLITNHFTHDRTTEPPTITTLVDRTVVVPTGEDYRFFFDIPRTGVLKATVEVESGGIIDFSLYKGSALWWNGEEGDNVIRSSFEVPIDAGSYYLDLSVPLPYWWLGETSRDRTVSVYLEFEG
jgi:hypothetical protein